jgi:hypothetical protein
MKTTISLLVSLALIGAAGAAAAQSAKAVVGPKLEDTCSITGRANDVRRIELVRLPNGFYGHRAYAADGKLICYSEWSATPALNLQAAQILRDKGNNQASIVDRVSAKTN